MSQPCIFHEEHLWSATSNHCDGCNGRLVPQEYVYDRGRIMTEFYGCRSGDDFLDLLIRNLEDGI